MAEQTSTGYFQNPFKFNGKSQRSEDPDPSGELDAESGLYYYGARYYDPRGSLWLSVDPMMEKYAGMSAYNFCANNPIILIDVKGEDLLIWYQLNGKPTSYSFNGKNQSSAPKNKFVQSVIDAYNYNTKNGGGQMMGEAASDHTVTIDILEHFESRGAPEFESRNIVLWNPNGGLLTEEGDILSPATVFEHEIDHRLHKARVGTYKHNKGLLTPSNNSFGNIEDERVITGSERLTGKKNNEFRRSNGRSSHGGVTVIVDGPTSTKANKQQSINYWKKLDQDSPHGINTTKQIKLIDKWIK